MSRTLQLAGLSGLLSCLLLPTACNNKGGGDETTAAEEQGDGDGDGDGDADSYGDGDGSGDEDTSGGCDQYGDCEALSSAFGAEAESIRSCNEDSECGMPLPGTSCGCTRDWVARTDAETTCFYELIDQAGPLQCDLGLVSDCSCPAADGYACVDGLCTWHYI